MARTYSISELSAEFGVTTRTIRFYEEKGLLKPGREGTRRVYSPADRTKLRLILRGKRLGLSLEESADIILMYGSPGSNRKQLQRLLERIEERRRELERQRSDLELTLRDLEQAAANCREALAQLGEQA